MNSNKNSGKRSGNDNGKGFADDPRKVAGSLNGWTMTDRNEFGKYSGNRSTISGRVDINPRRPGDLRPDPLTRGV